MGCMSVSAIVYTEDSVTDYDDFNAAKEATGTTWFNLVDPTSAELDTISEVCGIHRLAIEDVQSDARPKVEEFETNTFVFVKAARLASGDTSFEKEVTTHPIGLFVGDDWLATYTSKEIPAVKRTWESVCNEDARLLQRGPDFAGYRVLDRVVDDYFTVLDEIESRLEFVEEAVLDNTDTEVLEEINDARRDLLAFRKIVWPTRDAMSTLARGDPPQIRDVSEKYYRDVYDHLIQQVDLVETYRDLGSSARDIYLDTLSMSANEVMKALTVVATIVLPLTLVVGIFGMNFTGSPWNMPALAWRFSYPAVMIGMGFVAMILLWHVRREGWL